MSSDLQLVRELFQSLVGDATKAGLPNDVVGRLVLGEVIGLWMRERSVQDIGSELVFAAEHLDPATVYEFIRP